MNHKKEKFIFWIIGVGCGMLISGVLGISIHLGQVSVNASNVEEIVVGLEKENIEAIKIEEIKQETIQNEESTIKEETEDAIALSEEADKAEEGSQTPIEVIVPADSSANTISKILEENKIIDDSGKFTDYVIKSDKATLLRQGYFEFRGNMTYQEVLDTLLRKK